MQRGYLVLIGGAENNGGDRSILQHILDVTRAERIVLIPTASCYPRDVHRDYGDTFNVLNIPETTCLDIRDATEADRKEYLAAVDQADLVYFSGSGWFPNWSIPNCLIASGPGSRPASCTLPVPAPVPRRPEIP